MGKIEYLVAMAVFLTGINSAFILFKAVQRRKQTPPPAQSTPPATDRRQPDAPVDRRQRQPATA